MTDNEKEKIVLRVAAIVCGVATPEEMRKQVYLEQCNLEKEKWNFYLERKDIKGQEFYNKQARTKLMNLSIIPKDNILDVPLAKLDAVHCAFWPIR